MGDEKQRRTREDRQATREERKKSARANRDKRRQQREISPLDRNMPFDQDKAAAAQKDMFREMRDSGVMGGIGSSPKNRGGYQNNPLGSPPPGQPYLRSERDRITKIANDWQAKEVERNMHTPANVMLPPEVVQAGNGRAGTQANELRYHPAVAQKILERADSRPKDIPHPFGGNDQAMNQWEDVSKQITDPQNSMLYGAQKKADAGTRQTQINAYKNQHAPSQVQLPVGRNPDGSIIWGAPQTPSAQGAASATPQGNAAPPSAPLAPPSDPDTLPALYEQVMKAYNQGSQMPMGGVAGLAAPEMARQASGLQGIVPNLVRHGDAQVQAFRDWFNQAIMGQNTNHVEEAMQRLTKDAYNQKQSQKNQIVNPFK